jgi:cytochrome c
VAASKFKDWPHYGRSPRGHIALQGDHNGELAFRNIRIRELP